jgi:hypothetical protein
MTEKLSAGHSLNTLSSLFCVCTLSYQNILRICHFKATCFTNITAGRQFDMPAFNVTEKTTTTLTTTATTIKRSIKNEEGIQSKTKLEHEFFSLYDN